MEGRSWELWADLKNFNHKVLSFSVIYLFSMIYTKFLFPPLFYFPDTNKGWRGQTWLSWKIINFSDEVLIFLVLFFPFTFFFLLLGQNERREREKKEI